MADVASITTMVLSDIYTLAYQEKRAIQGRVGEQKKKTFVI
jgi:hypothetical protein